jgi:hypothetical protein
MLDQEAVAGAYSKAYTSCNGGVAVARLAEHRGYRLKKARAKMSEKLTIVRSVIRTDLR